MPASDIQRLGLPCSDSAAGFYIADSGVTAITMTPQTITASVPVDFAGNHPTVREGWLMVELSGAIGGDLTGQIDITVDDGAVTIHVDSIPVVVAGVANRGTNLLRPIFVTLSDSFVTIENVNVILATAAFQTGNARVYFFGSN